MPPAIKEAIPAGGLCHPQLKDKSAPILVSCGLGGQALIGAALLVDCKRSRSLCVFFEA